MPSRLRGFTLVEIVVSFAIVTLILSLTLVAVQSARESARRISCQNNLHQIGVAVTTFTSGNRVFPSLLANRGSRGNSAFDQSAFATILPELEVRQVDETDRGQRVPAVLRCPSSNNYLGYRYNYGSGVRTLGPLDGILRIAKGLAPAEVTDGLSNTSLIAERISGKESKKPVGLAALPLFLSDDGFIDGCVQTTQPVAFVEDTGIDWLGVQPKDLVYSHFARPNNSHWDCQASYMHQLVSARSFHSGGVFVLFADSHVMWIGTTVDLSVWQALGTVAGNDAKAAD